jgi:hypothetical protein
MRHVSHFRAVFMVILAAACLAGCQSNDKAQAADGPQPQHQSLWQRLTRASKQYTIPAGTSVEVRLSVGLSSRSNRSGDTFAATLAEPLVAGNRVLVPRGAMVAGEVVQAQASGHLKDPAELGVTLTSLEADGKDYDLSTSTDVRTAGSHKKHDAKWIGGAAVGGALLGALVGGGKGAAIGAGVGAGGGTAGAYATGRDDIVLQPETRLRFKLMQPLVITQPS